MQVGERAISQMQDHEPRAVVQSTPEPQVIRSASLLVLALLAVVFTLYIGKELLLPITLALLLKLLLQTPMRLLTTRLRLPGPIAAALVILALFGCIALLALVLSVLASDWIAKAPGSLGILQEKLAILRQPLEALQKVVHGVEQATTPSNPAGGEQAVTVQPGGGLLTLPWPWEAFLPAALYLLIHIAEGKTITPMLLASQFTLNPVVVIVSLFFWHAIWGVPGALPCPWWRSPRSSATAWPRCSRWGTSSAREGVRHAHTMWGSRYSGLFNCGSDSPTWRSSATRQSSAAQFLSSAKRDDNAVTSAGATFPIRLSSWNGSRSRS